MEVSAPIPGKHYHYRGRFCIITEWEGRTLLYDVFLNSGQLVACGFDALSPDEATAVEAIVSRQKGRSKND